MKAKKIGELNPTAFRQPWTTIRIGIPFAAGALLEVLGSVAITGRIKVGFRGYVYPVTDTPKSMALFRLLDETKYRWNIIHRSSNDPLIVPNHNLYTYEN